jgi:cell wall-associated NlpC family hydrolase
VNLADQASGQPSTPEPDRSHLAGVDEGVHVSLTTRMLAALAMLLSTLGVSAATASSADAAISRNTGLHAVRIASHQKGDWYQYGANGPNRFDCSGLTQYVYKRLGRSIPRTTDAQKAHLHRISKAHKRKGDIIVFVHGGDAYHVGIYVGHGRIIHAAHSGTRVRTAHIWTSSYVVRRP